MELDHRNGARSRQWNGTAVVLALPTFVFEFVGRRVDGNPLSHAVVSCRDFFLLLRGHCHCCSDCMRCDVEVAIFYLGCLSRGPGWRVGDACRQNATPASQNGEVVGRAVHVQYVVPLTSALVFTYVCITQVVFMKTASRGRAGARPGRARSAGVR